LPLLEPANIRSDLRKGRSKLSTLPVWSCLEFKLLVCAGDLQPKG
jgi:hypothetical protein